MVFAVLSGRRKGSRQNQINKKTGSLFRSTFIIDSPGCRRLLKLATLGVFTFRLAQHGKRLGDFGEAQVRLDAPAEAVAHGAVVVVRLDHRLRLGAVGGGVVTVFLLLGAHL